MGKPDYQEDVRKAIRLATDEIREHAADALLGSGKFIHNADVIIHIGLDCMATVEYRVELVPEGYVQQ